MRNRIWDSGSGVACKPISINLPANTVLPKNEAMKIAAQEVNKEREMNCNAFRVPTSALLFSFWPVPRSV